ncbi:hypothetical protein [Streptomyces sp. S186]|uniref:hypothetical protein n=1 Tax=Streptomyces sp. S186 TaxID=3434395 RepID=UPI003F668A58
MVGHLASGHRHDQPGHRAAATVLNALGHTSDLWVATTNNQGRRNVYINVDYLYRNDPQDLPPFT